MSVKINKYKDIKEEYKSIKEKYKGMREKYKGIKEKYKGQRDNNILVFYLHLFYCVWHNAHISFVLMIWGQKLGRKQTSLFLGHSARHDFTSLVSDSLQPAETGVPSELCNINPNVHGVILISQILALNNLWYFN